jgi:hypothetical protein
MKRTKRRNQCMYKIEIYQNNLIIENTEKEKRVLVMLWME